VSLPPRQHVKPDSKRLFQPLHYQRKLEAVGGLDKEQHASAPNDKPAYPEAVTPFRLAKYAKEKRFGFRQPEQWLADINRRLHPVPDIFCQCSFLPHIQCLRVYICGCEPVCFILTGKNDEKDEKIVGLKQDREYLNVSLHEQTARTA
jgi:hypothetical protein